MPDAVKSFTDHPPLVLAPGLRADEPSSLSFIAQFRCVRSFALRNSIQSSVELFATAPSPFAFTDPHSVTIKAIPLFIAVCAFWRRELVCVPA